MRVYVATVPLETEFEMVFTTAVEAQAFCLQSFGQDAKAGREVDLDSIHHDALKHLLTLPKLNSTLNQEIKQRIDEFYLYAQYFKEATVRNTVFRGEKGTKALGEQYPNLLRVRTYEKEGKTVKTVELVI